MEDAAFGWSRRGLVAAGASIAALALLPEAGWSRSNDRRLKFRHLHTDERLDVIYYSDGRYRPEALLQVDRLFRDWRENQAIRIDHRLMDFMHDVQLELGQFAEYEVLCGYRTQRTNDRLRRRSRGVARRSLHVVGKAVDTRLATTSVRYSREAALRLARGGVGYYPRSNFVHLDTGPQRSWRG